MTGHCAPRPTTVAVVVYGRLPPFTAKIVPAGVWADSGREGERVRSAHHGRPGQAGPVAVETPRACVASQEHTPLNGR